MADPINHPAHYTAHPSGIECIMITEHMGFCLRHSALLVRSAPNLLLRTHR